MANKKNNKIAPTEVAVTPTEVIAVSTVTTPLENVQVVQTTTPTEVAVTPTEVIEVSTATTPLENVEDAKTTAPTEVADVLTDIETKELLEYFESNPTEEQVIKVGRCLFAPIQRGAAMDYAKQFDLEIKEISNQNGKAQ